MLHLSKDDDDDDDFVVSNQSSKKLAALFSEDSQEKTSNLKYVAPKERDAKMNPNAEHDKRGEPDFAILYATAVVLYSYNEGVAVNQGRVMCCIIKNAGGSFALIVYKTQKEYIAQARINFDFNVMAQPNNYANFNDDKNILWCLHVDGLKFEEFLTQIGICRALSAFSSNFPPSIVTQNLSLGEGPFLQNGDVAKVSLCSWQVENFKRGKLLENLKESKKVRLNDSSQKWELALLGGQKNQHCIIFIANTQAYQTDCSSMIAYEVNIESVQRTGLERNTSPSISENISNNRVTDEEILPTKKKEKVTPPPPPSKAALISRMARVGQALLPTSKPQTEVHTDSESEVEEAARLRHQSRASTSSSMEEINACTPFALLKDNIEAATLPRSRTSSQQIPFKNNRLDMLNYNQPNGDMEEINALPKGVMMAYQPYPLQPVFQHQQQPSAAQSSSSDTLLSLLLSETRSQNTDLRVSLATLTEKIEVVHNKINSMGDKQGTTSSQNSLMPFSSYMSNHQPKFDPQELLLQITSLVNDNQTLKQELDSKNAKIEVLHSGYTEILQKNQRLLEEKTNLILQKEGNCQQEETKIGLKDVLSIQEEKFNISNQLAQALEKIKTLEDEQEQTKKQYTDLQFKFESLESDFKAENKLSADREEQLKNIQKQVAIEAKKHLEDLKENISILSSEKEKLSNEVVSLMDENQKLTLNINKNMLDLDILKRKSNERDDLLTEMEKEKMKLIRECDMWKEKAVRLKETEQAAKLTLGNNNKLTAGVEGKLAEQLQINNKLKKELEDWIKKYSTYEMQSQETIASLNNQLKLMQSSVIPNTPSQNEVPVVIKQIMNSTFKKVKTLFSSSETYQGKEILQNMLIIIRDTTLQYLDKLNNAAVEDANSGKEDALKESRTNKCSSNPPPLNENISSNLINENICFNPTNENDNSNLINDSVRSNPINKNSNFNLINENVSSDPIDEDFSSTPLNENVSYKINENVSGLIDNIEEEENKRCINSASVYVPTLNKEQLEDDPLSTLLSSKIVTVTESKKLPIQEENDLLNEEIKTSIDFAAPSDVSKVDDGSNIQGATIENPVLQDLKENVPKENLGESETKREKGLPALNCNNSSELIKTSTEEINDEEDWKPDPPPPPLFSESEEEDDDWLS